jgi:hypothetical protein
LTFEDGIFGAGFQATSTSASNQFLLPAVQNGIPNFLANARLAFVHGALFGKPFSQRIGNLFFETATCVAKFPADTQSLGPGKNARHAGSNHGVEPDAGCVQVNTLTFRARHPMVPGMLINFLFHFRGHP